MSERAPDRCPCCGGSLAAMGEVIWHADAGLLLWSCGHAFLSEREARVFDVLWRMLRSRERLSRDALVARAWANCADGGPNDTSTVSVHIWRIRRKIVGSPVTIMSKPHYGYRLAVRARMRLAAAA